MCIFFSSYFQTTKLSLADLVVRAGPIICFNFYRFFGQFGIK